MKKNTKFAIVVITILVIVAMTGSLFTTIYNPTGTIAPVFEQTFYDDLGNEIVDIHSATISGMVTFTAVVTNDPNPDVSRVTLSITPDGSDTPFGTYIFTQRVNNVGQDEFTLILDTTTIPNGDYVFDFTYNLVTDVAGDVGVSFSSLLFNFNNGDGTSPASVDMLTMLMLAGVGVLVVVFIFKKRK